MCESVTQKNGIDVGCWPYIFKWRGSWPAGVESIGSSCECKGRAVASSSRSGAVFQYRREQAKYRAEPRVAPGASSLERHTGWVPDARIRNIRISFAILPFLISILCPSGPGRPGTRRLHVIPAPPDCYYSGLVRSGSGSGECGHKRMCYWIPQHTYNNFVYRDSALIK